MTNRQPKPKYKLIKLDGWMPQKILQYAVVQLIQIFREIFFLTTFKNSPNHRGQSYPGLLKGNINTSGI
jgi:hypothetical protein